MEAAFELVLGPLPLCGPLVGDPGEAVAGQMTTTSVVWMVLVEVMVEAVRELE